MKAFRILALVLCVLLCAMALIACDGGDDPQPCETHNDADKDGICDVCSAEVDVPCTEHTDKNNDRFCDDCNELIPVAKYTVTVTVKDENGTPLSDISVVLRKENSNALSGMTNESGVVSGELVAGKYMLIVEGLPEYWYATGNYSTIQVNATSTAFEVTAVDNTPNGTTEKPFPAEDAESGETAVSQMPAGATYWYTTKGESRYLVIENSNIKVSYEGTEYLPDVGGTVRVLLSTSDVNENTMFAVINTADSVNTVTIGFEALPGTLGNPYVATLGVEQTATVKAGYSVYYTVTADKSGWLVLSSLSDTNNIMLFNTTASTVSNATNGAKTAMLYVNQGDVIRVTVSTLLEAPSDETLPLPQDEIAFTLSVCTGSESNPILFWDSCEISLASGETLHFRYMGEAGSLMVRTRDGSFYYLGATEAVSIVSGVQIEAGTAFYITNAGTRCEISVAVYPEE